MLLFVYGTLRSGFENEYARMLRANADFLGVRSVRGRLDPLGEYTAFVQGGEGTVSGELWRLRDARVLEALDEYEGSGYERVEVDVEGEMAWIYRLMR